MKSTTILLALFFIASCGEKAKLDMQAQEIAMGLSTGLEYDLTGVDDKDEACSTGRKTFQNLHDMCLDLQKPTDYECALLEKKTQFVKSCEPAGYKYREAVNCEVRLVEANTNTNMESDKIISSKKICVGPKTGSLTKDTEQTVSGNLSELIIFKMGLSVAADGQTTGLISVVDSTSNKAEIRNLEYKGIGVQSVVGSGDGRFIIQQTCQRTYACE